MSGRATVMAGLLENGKYENVFYSDNLRAVGGARFQRQSCS